MAIYFSLTALAGGVWFDFCSLPGNGFWRSGDNSRDAWPICRTAAVRAGAESIKYRMGQLLLEEGAWSTPARIEQIATQRLGMRIPDVNDVEVIRP